MKKEPTTNDCSETGTPPTGDEWRVPSKLSRRRFALGSAAVIGAAVTEAGAAAQLTPLSAEAQSWHLEKTDEVADTLDERHILDEDLKRVIQNAESTGEKLYQTDTDRFLSKLRVGDVMARNPKTCSPTDSVAAAEAKMTGAQVRRLPVVDSGGQLLGVLSLADIAHEFARERGAGKKGVSAAELSDLLAGVCAPHSPLVAASA